MAEGRDQNLPKIDKLRISRRDFLKGALRLLEYAGLTAIGKFFYNLYKAMFIDMAALTHCLSSNTPEFNNIQRELNDSYETALIVVHPGYDLLRAPSTYSDNEEYKSYLERLKRTIEEARENGELVILLIGAEDMRNASSVEGLSFSDADAALVTSSGNPTPIACFETRDGNFLFQNTDFLPQILREKGVRNIHLTGENRKTCVEIEETRLSEEGFQVAVLNEVVYPLMRK